MHVQMPRLTCSENVILLLQGMAMFKNRLDAAHQLTQSLWMYKGQNPLVLAIPRGAVPMGQSIAQGLQGEWDVVLVRKLRDPYLPELAVGAIDESGATYIASDGTVDDIPARYWEAEKKHQLEILRERRAQYTSVHPAISPVGRIVIVVDDGLATGATMLCALQAVRRQSPAKLICAVPVASAHATQKVRSLCDEVVCLSVPPQFEAVSEFYLDFPQVSDEEVLRLLRA